MGGGLLFLVATLCTGLVISAPNSLVLTTVPVPPSPPTLSPSTPPSLPGFVNPNLPGTESTENVEESASKPEIYQFDISSNISNRFARTLVTSKVRNPETKAKEATFTVVLPEKAFISEFVMEIDGKSYKAYVKEKEEAKQIYDEAVQSGQSAGHVAVSARDSNRFTVSVNVEPEKKATFFLTYEELLERRNNQYELVLNIHPGQVVKHMNIEVFVNESRHLKFVRTPSLRSGNEISKNDDKLDPDTSIEIVNSTSAVAKFTPNEDQQKLFAKELGGKENDGLAGQFVLQYDVERDPRGGEVLIQDGYFVHFFAPDELEPLPKHIVFVLDTSGSMSGTKITQLRDAMISILNELREEDSYHIVEFNTHVYVWNTETQEKVKVTICNDKEPFEDLMKQEYPSAVQGTKESIEKGKQVIQKLKDDSLTNIMDSLSTALHLVHVNLKKDKKEGKFNQPIILFLTDGDPTVANSDTTEITRIVTKMNSEKDQVPLFSLSFGEGADKYFLRKLSLKNNGFSRHIYEGADASLQLQEFYKQISSPLLSNVNFKYTSDVKEITKTVFPIYFRGGEMASAGRTLGYDIKFVIEGVDVNGTSVHPSVIETPVTSLERLWAYMTIKHKLEQRELVENKTQLTKEALDLALKYSFVTDVSSLVVVKPNDTSAVDTEDASKSNRFGMYHPLGQQSLHASVYYDPPPTILRRKVVTTTRRPFTSPACITKIPLLSSRFPWLSSVLNSNGTLVVKGALLDLGESIYLKGTEDCTGTPRNATEVGVCSPLNSCTHVFSLLKDFQTYEKFSCQVENKYAGICCPKLPVGYV